MISNTPNRIQKAGPITDRRRRAIAAKIKNTRLDVPAATISPVTDTIKVNDPAANRPQKHKVCAGIKNL